MQIAIIGAGNVGGALGVRWARLGHAVRFGVPNPLAPKYAPLRVSPGAVVCSPKDAVKDADAIVLATPWASAQEAIRDLGPLGDAIVIDCTNPVKFGPDGVVMAPIDGPSGADLIAAAANGGRFVKTLNQVGFNIMVDPMQASAPALMLVAGDDAAAKSIATDLVRELGFDARDAGPLRNAGALENLALLWIDQAFRGPHGRDFVLSVAPLRAAYS
jgi:8-hydroxy-5-deazaflavin:NADPH oxidoreductase